MLQALLSASGVVIRQKWLIKQSYMDTSFRQIAAILFVLASIGLPMALAHAESNWAGATPLRDLPLPPLEQRFPVNNHAESIQDSYVNPQQWDGHSISLEGTIKSVTFNAKSQPSFELTLNDKADVSVWVVFPQPVKPGSFLKVGERLRLLGWMHNASDWAKAVGVTVPTQHPLVLLSICLVKVPSFSGAFDSKYLEYCAAWQKGYMPPDLTN